MTRRTLCALSALAPVAGVLLAAESKVGVESGPVRPGRGAGFRGNYFPNVALRTHEGREVRFYDDLLKERIVVINFMYTRCKDGVCPITTANLVRVQRLLKDRVGRDIFMYSITLKPEQDTAPVLKRYAQAHGVGPGWWFLTGGPADIELIRRKLGYVDLDPVVDADKSQHIGMVRYGNEALQRWGAVPGGAHPRWIAKSILWAEGPTRREVSRGEFCRCRV